ncbi:MAG TPA: hypothetical protein VNS09_11845 [Solirubrobacter sp.]|nr:hypothetical protein [Solirubrobacter sp.]
MTLLRPIAATLAAALLAAALSVGAALATDHPAAGTHFTPTGVCLLGDAAARPSR